MPGTPRVLVILDDGASIRHLCASGVLASLRAQGMELILLDAPLAEQDRIRQAVGGCTFATLQPPPFRGLFKLVQRLRTYCWRTRIKAKDLFDREGRKTGAAYWTTYALGWLCRPIPEAFWNFLAARSASWPQGTEWLRQPPAAVIFCNPFHPCCRAVQALMNRNVRSICVLQSWDALVVRGAMHVHPHHLVVWNRSIARQATRFHRFPARRIHSTGIPSFDLYHHPDRIPSEAAWRTANGLPSSGPVITYTLSRRSVYEDEDLVVQSLLQARAAGRLPADAAILVRCYPENNPDDFQALIRRYASLPGLHLQLADASLGLRLNDPTSGGTAEMLAATMRHSAVVINIFSTICLDALCNGTPVIAVNYDCTPKPYHKSVRGFMVFDHIKELIASQAVLVANSPDELIAHTAAALAGPSIRQTERHTLVHQATHGLLGRASSACALTLARLIRD